MQTNRSDLSAQRLYVYEGVPNEMNMFTRPYGGADPDDIWTDLFDWVFILHAYARTLDIWCMYVYTYVRALGGKVVYWRPQLLLRLIAATNSAIVGRY